MVKYELESTLRRGQDHQQKQSEAVIRVMVFISRKDLISSQKWLLSTRVYFHTSGFILPLKHQGPFKAQSPQTQHSLRPGSGSSKDWDHIKRYRHLKLETILEVWGFRECERFLAAQRAELWNTSVASKARSGRPEATAPSADQHAGLGYPQHPVLSMSARAHTFTIKPNMKMLEDVFFSTTRVYLCPSSKTFKFH